MDDVAAEPETGCNATRNKDLENREQLLYEIENSGTKDMKPIPIDGGKPWDTLRPVVSASLDKWTFHVGDNVTVRCTENNGLTKVSNIRRLDQERYLLVLAWYYTREDIMKVPGGFRCTLAARCSIQLHAQFQSHCNNLEHSNRKGFKRCHGEGVS